MELGVKIAENDPVRKLVEICDELDYTELYKQYVKKWRKYAPETLFELVVLGYMQRRFSTRQIEEACKTDIRFMWILQGQDGPDHSTIDRFLDKRLADVLEDLFYQLVDRLCVLGELKYKNMFVDGTKPEDNANRISSVSEPSNPQRFHRRAHTRLLRNRDIFVRRTEGDIFDLIFIDLDRVQRPDRDTVARQGDFGILKGIDSGVCF